MSSRGTDDPLETMHRTDFLRAVRHAQSSHVSVEARRSLLLWAQRLMPYFKAHPEWTLQEALDRYHRDVDAGHIAGGA